ncbi:Hypothetical protein D9617_10g072450 [Elsinoe fawcettii]|nr:Hypothetical protein D9617_10g072450 [Elsinoe fawcettii]
MTLGNLSGITNSTHTHKEESRPDESRRQGRFLPQAASAGAERISFRSRIPSAPKGILTGNRSKPLMRSDTEPLLPLAGGTLPKTPATKENVLPRSLTRSKLTVFRGSHTEKPLPPCPSRRSISTTRSPTDEQLRIKYATTKKIDTHSDPAKARLVDMPRRALPRFNTQPDLSLTTTTITGSRIKSRTDIKHHTLLSPKHPPTPTQRSPLSTVTNFQRSTSRPRALYEKSTPTTPIPKSTTPAETPPPDTFNSAAVIDAEPIPYWSGRFLSQLDHWRTQDFNSRCTASVTSLPHHIYSKSQEMEQREQYCHILSSLYADCETEDAKESLQIFHSYLKALHVRTAVGEEEGIAARASWSNICGEGERIRKKSRGREETPESLGKMRRGTFMERLLGRRARM